MSTGSVATMRDEGADRNRPGVSDRSTRALRAAEVRSLRAQGLLQREIAARLNISRSYVNALITDPDGSKVRERKRRYGGQCENCGAPTDGSNGRGRAPRYCNQCFHRSPEFRAAITRWTPELIVARIREWAALYGEPPAMADWSPWHARNAYGDEERARRCEDANGYWPWMTSTVRCFGSWNAAIAAAGFEPRASVGTTANARRKRQRRNRG